MTAATLAFAALLAARAPVPFEAEIDTALAETAAIYPVPKALVLAVISVESGFRPRAISRAGAKGLMQLTPYTARRLGVAERDLFDPAKNILAGVRLLAVLLRHYDGDVISTLVAYNARPRRVLAPVPRNGETPGYVWLVLARARSIQSTAPSPFVGGRPSSASIFLQLSQLSSRRRSRSFELARPTEDVLGLLHRRAHQLGDLADELRPPSPRGLAPIRPHELLELGVHAFFSSFSVGSSSRAIQSTVQLRECVPVIRSCMSEVRSHPGLDGWNVPISTFSTSSTTISSGRSRSSGAFSSIPVLGRNVEVDPHRLLLDGPRGALGVVDQRVKEVLFVASAHERALIPGLRTR